MRMGGQLHAPAALPPGMTRYPLYRRLHQLVSGKYLSKTLVLAMKSSDIFGSRGVKFASLYLKIRIQCTERFLENTKTLTETLLCAVRVPLRLHLHSIDLVLHCGLASCQRPTQHCFHTYAVVDLAVSISYRWSSYVVN
jgi:hypothetical protein